MAMFGGFGAKRAPFDMRPQTYGTPGIGDGLPGATPMGGPAPMGDFISPETRNILDNAPAAPQPSKFGARDVVGIIGDTLSAMGGGQGVYTQMKLRERDTNQRMQMAQQERQAGMEDWRAKFDYERQFPKSVSPHYWETNDGSLGMVGPDGQPQILFKDPTPKINWIKADNGDGTQSLIPVGPDGPISAKGGDQASGAGGGATAPAPSQGGFMTLDQFGAMRSVPTFKPGHPAWDTPVQIQGDDDFDRLPSGKTFIGPDGIVRRK